MNLEILTCPNCHEKLFGESKIFKCANNHSFDLAKEGYLNLLLPNQKKTKLPGDNKEMIENRERFLSEGFYKKMVDQILVCFENMPNPDSRLTVLDVGCGSGFFLRQIANEKMYRIGLDISKYAMSKAARLDKGATYVVSSYKSCPIGNESIDVIINNFAPLDLSEASRVLKPGGSILKIVPYKNHMKQLAQLIYREFHPHTSDFTNLIEKFNSFDISQKKEITYECSLTRAQALNLIGMTPYFHKFKGQDIEIPESLIVTFSFLIIEVLKK